MASCRKRRSALYLPASNMKALVRARALACDVVILDLEDAVAPGAKAEARAQAVAALREGGFEDRELVVRVNGIDTEWGEDDLAALDGARPDAVLIPKIGSAADLQPYADRLWPVDVPIWAMIETARSLFNLDNIASASRLRGSNGSSASRARASRHWTADRSPRTRVRWA